ncbi:amidase [Sphingomonas sp. YL-JM2C]
MSRDIRHPSTMETGLAELRRALDERRLTSVELLTLYLNRIAHYDRHGIALNAVPLFNPAMFEEARRSDERRARGETLGPLDGIPYIAKDSYAVEGLAVASGSPAFEHLIAGRDAYAIARLRAAGAILIGLTNMPPMAAGGMQRGVYGRAESPYNAHFLTAAFASGSSNGSGTGTAAGFAAFGLAEETWSSGRAPASNNGLAAYTPSRGVISIRGNWPLIATMDVVVPYARSMDDLLELLDVLVADDAETRGDFWRQQGAVAIPKASEVRPADYRSLRDPDALAGKRIGIPRMYINKDPDGPRPIATRPSIVELWGLAERDLKALGAEVVEVDFPLISNYEADPLPANRLVERGLVPEGFPKAEGWDLTIFAWDDYLRANGDPKLNRLADVDGEKILPAIPGFLPDRYEGIPPFSAFAEAAARDGVTPREEIAFLEEGLAGLERARRIDLEDWMTGLGLDAVVFPAVADIGPADSDINPLSQDAAWRNGVWVANGNQAIRHLGVPTVTVPMGMMADIAMPVGLTFAGRAYDDNALLAYAYAFEASRRRVLPPRRTPPLPEERALAGAARDAISGDAGRLDWRATLLPVDDSGHCGIAVEGEIVGGDAGDVRLFVNGRPLSVRRDGRRFSGEARLPMETHSRLHSRWRGPYGSIVVALHSAPGGRSIGDYQVVGGIA